MAKLKYPATLILAILSVITSTYLKAQNSKTEDVKKDHLKMAFLSYEKYIDENSDAHLREYLEFVAIPSISSMPSHKSDIEKAASWIVNKLKAIGMTTAETIPTKGYPVVYGSWDKAPGKPTVLIYAHYDVQPVRETEWDNPPFAPKVENGKIFGRGVSDDKSGVMIPIWAVEAMLMKNKELPVNVKYIFDGEEESGSPSFQEFITNNKELLKADFALNADGAQFNDSIPSIWMALRGGVRMEFSIKTANTDAHSGYYGGKTPNAVRAMSEIISSFYKRDGSVAVEGFYDKVLPITDREREMINRVPYDKATDMKMLGTTAEVGDTSYSPLERIWYRPTLEITGMSGGYTAKEGWSNIIPGTATARINCRLVNNQSGTEIVDLIVKHINKNCPPGSTVSYKIWPGFTRPIKFPADTKAYDYVSASLQNVYGRPPLQTALGGSIGPIIDIKEQLGIYAYSFGFQQTDERAHAANEFFRVSSMRKGQLVYCYYLQLISEQENNPKSKR